MKCLADGCYQYGEGAQHKRRKFNVVVVEIKIKFTDFYILIRGGGLFKSDIKVQNIPLSHSPAVCSKWHTVWNSTCSWEYIPCLRCLPFRVFCSVILQTIPVPPGACCCTPDALNAWRIIICLKSVLTCFFGDKNKKATGVVFTSEEHQNILSWIQCCSVLRTFSVFQLKVMKSLGALTACLAWAGMPLECPQCPPCPAAHPV